ncbi:MAG TPA: AAA domain-containing protein [Streptosporangiaceae bacterium]|nr:AAA domain-containing protein [Streptosporangiaceae bacterium]
MTLRGGAAELAERATAGILADLGRVRRGVVVDSPPGAGKSALVVRVAADLAAAGERVMVVAQTNEQVDDLTDRLAGARPRLAIGRLAATGYTSPERVAKHQRVTLATNAAGLVGCPVVLSTAHKWAMTRTDAAWPWAIVDEAYQMRSDLLLRVAGLFDRALFVGDPGQLDPFSAVQTERWTGLTWDPMQSAVAVLLRHNPDVPVHLLPVSWRLPESAATVVAGAFYPFTGFRPATGAEQRRVEFSTRPFGHNALDLAVETAAASGWALYELPARHTVRTDAEAAGACAALAARIVQRGAVSYSERAEAGAPVTADRVAVGTAHRDQAQAIRAILRAGGLPGITVDTANRLQGREFDIVVVLHPLSGRRDATAFHLEAGRLCVLTTRHRHACIVVARAGIPELLDAHPSTEPVHLNVPVKFPDGWEAHQSLLAHLQQWKVRAP